MLSVYFNATPLLLPKTGIYQYSFELLKQVSLMSEISSHYFYLTGWSDELRGATENRRPSRLWRLKSVLRDAFPPFLEIQHRIREKAFRIGLRKAGAGVYHELNFLPFATDLPTVTTIHDLSILRFPETHPAARVRYMARRLASAVESSTVVLTDSEYVRNEVIDHFDVSSNKVKSIALAAAGNFRPQPPETTAQILAGYGLAINRYVLAVGTLEPRKNLAIAIRAFAQLPKRLRNAHPLVIAGMRGWENSALDALLRPMLESGDVRTLGFVPDADLPALYAGASVFVYPSLYEGFGLPPLEAMACGAPVIVSNRSSLPEVVGDAGVQVEALDVDALTEAMRRVIEDDNLRLMLGRRGIERAANFSWQKCAQETAAIYRKVAA